MTAISDFFQQQAEPPLHPRVGAWKARLSRPGVLATLELYRPPKAFGLVRTEMNLQFVDNGEQQPLETLDWDDEMNAGLIQLHVKAVNPDQEAERFALGLRGALRPAEREFGDGYFNAVLLEFIKDSDFMQDPDIADVVKHAYGTNPNHGKSYPVCKDMIADAIRGRAHELTELLGYPLEGAKQILIRAVARFADERFSVSSRRELGML